MESIRFQVWFELVDISEAAGLAGSWEEAFVADGAPISGAVPPDVVEKDLVFLGGPGALLHLHGFGSLRRIRVRVRPRAWHCLLLLLPCELQALGHGRKGERAVRAVAGWRHFLHEGYPRSNCYFFIYIFTNFIYIYIYIVIYY